MEGCHFNYLPVTSPVHPLLMPPLLCVVLLPTVIIMRSRVWGGILQTTSASPLDRLLYGSKTNILIKTSAQEFLFGIYLKMPLAHNLITAEEPR